MFSNIPVLFAGLNKLIEKLDKRGEKKMTKKKSHTFQSYPRFVRSPSKAIPSHRAPPWAIHRSYWSVLESAVSSEASMNTSTEARQSSIAPSSVQPSTSQSTPTSHSSYSQRMLTFDLSPVGPTNSSQEGGSSDSSAVILILILNSKFEFLFQRMFWPRARARRHSIFLAWPATHAYAAICRR